MTNLFAIAFLFALAAFSYAAFSTMALVLPSDLYESRTVATVSGLCGTAASILTIGCTFLIGRVSDRYSFTPILIGGSIIPLIGASLVFVLVRNTLESGRGIVRRI